MKLSELPDSGGASVLLTVDRYLRSQFIRSVYYWEAVSYFNGLFLDATKLHQICILKVQTEFPLILVTKHYIDVSVRPQASAS